MDINRSLKDISDANWFLASLKYLKGQMLFRAGLRSHGSGATVARGGLQKSAQYLEIVVQDYLKYGGLCDADLSGKHILEIGPGDTLGVALLLLAKGAASVTCLDRFKPKIDAEKNRAICSLLLANLSGVEQVRIQNLLEHFVHNESSPDGRLIARYGIPIEQLSVSSCPDGFDLIISRAVLEHVYNLHEAWMGMVRVLKPTGRMLHKVDFRSHKFFNKVHPLFFLSFDEWLWNALSSPDPTLNRKRKDTYDALLKDTFRDHRIYYTSVLENQELMPHPTELLLGEHYDENDLLMVQGIRPRLSKQFRNLDDLDLLVSGIFIDCRTLLEIA